jgi:hypothetical protein
LYMQGRVSRHLYGRLYQGLPPVSAALFGSRISSILMRS